MSAISIRVTSTLKKHRDGVPYYKGEIQIGDHKETLFIAVNYWTLDDYKKQWRQALERIKTHDTSMLVVSVRNPQRDPKLPSPSFENWSLYKIDGKIIAQPGILFNPFLDSMPYKGPFTLDTWPNFLTPLSTEDVDEWSIDLADLEHSNVPG